ncbi:hypothetical protein EVAR_25625_1 [Eumeta japonica]|uniref:Retinol dehydrogenase 12 n=1 Tax=Eumeta variegata TaxID=151549 RepID=A0A4C1V1G8_EUMVA|nr:hypothetical protein EVAR_25625_1 [Eumeta japonica]
MLEAVGHTTHETTTLTYLRMMECAGITLPDSSFFSPAFLFYAITMPSWLTSQRQSFVFMACRDMKSCEKVRKDIVLETENKYVYCRPCDLSSLRSVADFVARLKTEEPHIHVLVNNAAVMVQERSLTKDGFELDLGVNHMGHFLLTSLLLDMLKKTEDSRIIILSCPAYLKGTINKEDLNWEKSYDPQEAYNQSKLANVLFGREVARRLLANGVQETASKFACVGIAWLYPIYQSYLLVGSDPNLNSNPVAMFSALNRKLVSYLQSELLSNSKVQTESNFRS